MAARPCTQPARPGREHAALSANNTSDRQTASNKAIYGKGTGLHWSAQQTLAASGRASAHLGSAS